MNLLAAISTLRKKPNGYESADGAHAGDMPNIYVDKTGTANVDVVAPHVTLDGGPDSLIRKEGAALVIHALKDDYKTSPSGAAGARIACGVIQ